LPDERRWEHRHGLLTTSVGIGSPRIPSAG
jgi:hypothetical protein